MREKNVRILCVADEVDLLIYSSNIVERFQDIDLILSAGDLPPEYLEFIASMLNKPIISVAGNHDSAELPRNHDTLRFSNEMQGLLGQVHFGLKKECGLRILGLPGSIRYNNGKNQYSDSWMTCRIIALLPKLLIRRILHGRAVDIILAHSPPRGIHDGGDPAHIGFTAYRWLIYFARPYFFIHGHVHLYDIQSLREIEYFGTKVVNVYGHSIVTVSQENRDAR